MNLSLFCPARVNRDLLHGTMNKMDIPTENIYKREEASSAKLKEEKCEIIQNTRHAYRTYGKNEEEEVVEYSIRNKPSYKI